MRASGGDDISERNVIIVDVGFPVQGRESDARVAQLWRSGCWIQTQQEVALRPSAAYG
jgi:hypothetical protein